MRRTPRYGRSVESPDVDAALARELRAIAQEGLTYSSDVFDRKRYEAIAAIAAQAAGRVAGRPAAMVWPSFLDDSGHPTPKVDVRGAVFRDGALLLVRERSDGGWTLPGGWADPGHSASENVEREVREESGLAVRATRLVAVLDRERHVQRDHTRAMGSSRRRRADEGAGRRSEGWTLHARRFDGP